MKLNKIRFNLFFHGFFLILFLLIFGCVNNQSNASIKPNIILIIGDDHGYPYFGFMGSKYVKTPNLDTLAHSGVLFKNGFVPDNHCRPALQSLITGMLPHNFNRKRDSIKQVKKEDDSILKMSQKSKEKWGENFNYHALKYFQTMPGELSKLGYNSFQSGKWWEFHYEYGGFTDGMTTGWRRETHNGRNWFQQFMGGEGTDIGRISNKPIFDFIDKNKSDPFFIWYAPQLPHYPFDAPEKYRQLYSKTGFSKSAIEYYANCTWFDDSVGELVSYLKRKNLFENTLFIYVNDNGWEQEPHQEFFDDPMRSHNGGDKGKLSVFDQSYKTPIIFSWKNKIYPDIKDNSLIHSADIPATILDFAGSNKSKMNHGVSFKDVIEGKVQEHRNIIIGNSNKIRDNQDPMGRDVETYWGRDKKWFYKSNLTDQTNALYNIIDDPFCTNNVIKNNPDIVQKFANRIFQRYQKLTF